MPDMLSSQEIIRVLERHGFDLVSQKRSLDILPSPCLRKGKL
jgi:predicted RNA binding protein YcfA (HicA-like mRNA interferase family)